VHDNQLFFFTYKLAGLSLLLLGNWSQARNLFELIRDLTTECENYGNLMDAYELLGRSLEAGFSY
jgi:hypothetical protein